MRLLAILLILWSTPAYAAPWYCPMLKAGIAAYGDAAAKDYAKTKGYSLRQYIQAKKECKIG